MQYIKNAIKRLLTELKLNPEWIAIPIVILAWFSTQYVLLLDTEANGVISNDTIQFFILASFGLLLGNLLSHLGIKYNNPSVWKQYKSSVQYGTMPPKEYFYYLALYLSVYALILIAIFP